VKSVIDNLLVQFSIISSLLLAVTAVALGLGSTENFRRWTIWSIAKGFFVLYGSLVAIVRLGWRTIVGQRTQLELVNTALEVKVTELRESNHLVNAEIAQRRRAEEEVHLQSEITANMAEGVYLIRTSDGVIVYTNSKFEEMFGYERGELAGKHVSLVNAPRGKTPKEVAREIIDSLNENGAWTGEVQNIKKDGETFWCHASVSTFEHHEFGPVWVAVHTDITERKRAEEALRQQGVAMNSSRDGMSICNQKGEFVYVNDAFVRMYGYGQPDELIGKNWNVLYTQEELKRFDREILPEFLRQGNWQGETIGNRQDGSKFPQEISMTALPGGGLVCTDRDITDRKRGEEALRESEQAARRLAQENTSLAEIGRIISSSLDIEEVYQRFANEVRKLIPFDRIVVVIVDLEQGTFRPAYIMGTEVPGRRVGDIIPLAGSVSAEVIRNKSRLLINAKDDEGIPSHYPAIEPSYLAGLRSIIAVPLISQDRVIGSLQLRSTEPDAYTERHLALLESVGAQIAGAIANAQLYEARKQAEEEERIAAQENRALAEIGRIVSSSLDINDVYDLLGEEIKGLISFDRMSLSLVDQEGGVEGPTWVTGIEVPGRRPGDLNPIEGTLAGEVIRINSPMLVEADTDADLDHLPGLLPNFHVGMRSFMAAPLLYRDDPIAVLQVRSRHTGVYSQRHLDILGRVGSQIAGAVANAQLYTARIRGEEALREREEEARRLAQENTSLAQIGRIISSSLAIEDIYERFANEVRKLIPFDRIMVGLVDQEHDTFSPVYIFGNEVEGRGVGDIIALAGSATEEVIRKKAPLLMRSGSDEGFLDRFPATEPAYRAGLRSIIAVPLISQSQVIGFLRLQSTDRHDYTERDLALLESVGAQIAGAIASAELYRARKEGEEALRKSGQRIRELAAASVQTHEEDRQWIALEVHDRISQPLFAVFQQLLKLEAKTRDDPEAWQEARRASAILNEAIRESRNIMNDLYPAGLDEFGIVTLLEEELERLQEDMGCTASFDDDCPVRPPREVEITLYRIFHEALTNIRRHASGARNVGVFLGTRDQLAVLQVRDDGPGFDVEGSNGNAKVGGLMSMKRRAEIIGGSLDIESTPGQGTFLTVRVPIRETNGQGQSRM